MRHCYIKDLRNGKREKGAHAGGQNADIAAVCQDEYRKQTKTSPEQATEFSPIATDSGDVEVHPLNDEKGAHPCQRELIAVLLFHLLLTFFAFNAEPRHRARLQP